MAKSSTVKDEFLDIRAFYGGISDSRKLGPKGSYQFGQAINIRDEATEFHLQPTAEKVSSSTVTGLIKWIVEDPVSTNIYFYDANGVIYQQDSGGTWSVLRTVSNSKGQGLEIYADYLYYAQNTQVGRYGPLSSSPSFTDAWATGYEDTSLIGFAPIKAFVGGMAIGHGNYLAWFDGTVVPSTGYTSAESDALHELQFNPSQLVRCLEVNDEYLAIGTQKGTDILANESGYVFYWDGSSTTFNYFMSTENGGVCALGNSNNRLFSILGSSSKLFLNYRPFQPIQRIPKLTIKHYCEVWPGAVTTWQNLIHIGLAANTDSSSIYQGVYSWGRTSAQFPECLTYDYPISTGNTNSTNVKIGALKGLGNYLYIGWQDGSNYGVDKVTANGTLASEGSYESLVFGEMSRNNQALTIKCAHYPLQTGESVQIGYRLDRFSDYIYPEAANTTIDSMETRLPVQPSDAIYYEIEFIIKLTSTGATSPTVIYCGCKFDPLAAQFNDW
jgi:hypothetical protein